MKNIMKLAFALLLAVSLLTGCQSAKADEMPTIAIVTLMEHTSLNTIYENIVSQLNAEGYVDGESAHIEYKNAYGEQSNIASIMNTYEANKPDILITITTTVTQAAYSLTNDVPIVFAAVTDPISAGLATTFEDHEPGITGTSDALDVKAIIDLALQMSPDVKTFGLLYNNSDTNSVPSIATMKEYLDELGIGYSEASVSSTSEVAQATESLCSKVDAILIPKDNTIASAMANVSEICNGHGIPTYVGADSIVSDGGLASVGITYDDLGKESAKMAVRVLKGENIDTMPIKRFDELTTFINTTTASKLGIALPEGDYVAFE